MAYIADLHFHSKYSRAVSQDMTLPVMAKWAKKKGIDILTTADWTHPLWFREIKNQLVEKADGLFQLEIENEKPKTDNETLFLLSTEISSIYTQGGQVRRVHNLVFSPSFETCQKINEELLKRGCNLMSDGRPIIGLSSRQLIELVLSIDKSVLFIPCHAWTPWFSLYGSKSGFDSIDECFEDYSKYIYAIETGLSSDPEMNWRIKELENRSIVSFSDAHSPAKMGREATVFELEKPTYENIRRALTRLSVLGSQLSETGVLVDRLTGQQTRSAVAQARRETERQISENRKQTTDNRIVYTIEFYPEEGKYHYTGHRNCKVVQTPSETKEKGVICPVCKKPLTVGVMHRVEQLAQQTQNSPLRQDFAEQANLKTQNDENSVRWINDPIEKHPPFVKLVPLLEIVAESLNSTVQSARSIGLYDNLCQKFGSELNILLKIPIDEISKINKSVADGVLRVRKGDIVIEPGFDGEYGNVKIWPSAGKSESESLLGSFEQIKLKKEKTPQLSLDF